MFVGASTTTMLRPSLPIQLASLSIVGSSDFSGDERTRTADLISLRVGLWLSQGLPPRSDTYRRRTISRGGIAPPTAYQPGCSTIAVNEPDGASPLTRPSQEPHREGTTCGYRGRQGVEPRCQRGQVVGRRGKNTFCADPQGSDYEDPHSEYRQQKRQAR